MPTKKVTKTIELVVNLGNYSSARFTSGVETELSYANETDLMLQEHKMWLDISEDLRTGMWQCFETMGEYEKAATQFASNCRRRLETETLKNTEPAEQVSADGQVPIQ